MSFVFGPVPSRRLGRSLGVDCLPYKTCNLDCVYCECGATTRQQNTRENWFLPEEIIEELKDRLARDPQPDWITFAGSGEPSLYTGLGELVEGIRALTEIPLALITNGVLFTDPAVRDEASRFDLVLPSLDCVSNEIFQRINRPLPGLEIRDLIAGLVAFRRQYKKSIWLEVFIIPGINDGPAELSGLREAILAIAPERVQLNTLDRPGSEKDLESATLEALKEVALSLDLPNLEIIARGYGLPGLESLPEPEAEKRILVTLLRRPSTKQDLLEISGLPERQLGLLLTDIERRGMIKLDRQGGLEFWSLRERG